MPCYLFTWHAYGSWLPDRSQGHFHWKRGQEEQSVRLAECYRTQQKESVVEFAVDLQQQIIAELQTNSFKANYRLHSVACDASHIHALVSWNDDRDFGKLRKSIRTTMTTRLNRRKKRTWFSREGTAHIRVILHSKQIAVVIHAKD